MVMDKNRTRPPRREAAGGLAQVVAQSTSASRGRRAGESGPSNRTKWELMEGGTFWHRGFTTEQSVKTGETLEPRIGSLHFSELSVEAITAVF